MNDKILYITDMPGDVALNAEDHNYLKLYAAFVPKELFKVGVYDFQVEHDDSCEIFNFGNCNCKPNITIISYATQEVVFALRWVDDRN